MCNCCMQYVFIFCDLLSTFPITASHQNRQLDILYFNKVITVEIYTPGVSAAVRGVI